MTDTSDPIADLERRQGFAPAAVHHGDPGHVAVLLLEVIGVAHHVLAIDVGTYTVKVALVSIDGEIVASEQEALEVTLLPGGAEQDPERPGHGGGDRAEVTAGGRRFAGRWRSARNRGADRGAPGRPVRD